MTSAAAQITLKQRIGRVWYFFPLRLLVLHIKKNHFLLFFWVLLFAFTEGFIGSKYGVNDQFLFPEYQGETGFLSFALLGFMMGGFILAFNLYTYILHGFRFPFIATLNRPFVKFSVNNFIIPLAYVVTYCFLSVRYQIDSELLSAGKAWSNIGGLFSGMMVFLVMSALYFGLTNKSLVHIGKQDEKEDTPIHTTIHKKQTWYSYKTRAREWRVDTYMSSFIRIALARESHHYDKQLLEKVFAQNHINASIFEVGMILTFIAVGSFREYDLFVIPAAASVILFFMMLLMVVSAIFSYIKGWTITVFLILFLLINYSFEGLELFYSPNKGYGLDYSNEPTPYNRETLAQLGTSQEQHQESFNHALEMLENWRRKFDEKTVRTGVKPKLVLINPSGGGLRSSLWSLTSLMVADSTLDGGLLNSAFLITGSSGGMIGAGYARELYLRKKQGEKIDPYDPIYQDKIGRDILNPVLFSIATNDLFIRYQKFDHKGIKYIKDRGYAFEKQLHKNTDSLMFKTLGEYSVPEYKAEIPMMIMAPTILNDGRRLIISSQPVSYLSEHRTIDAKDDMTLPEDVEYSVLFKDHDPENLSFSSALRMNATFPYVTPVVTLPSDPPISVMDAGLRDNFGTKTTLHFLYTFRNWINTNTSGVIIVQIRDIQKDFNARSGKPTLISEFTAPLGSVYGNFTKMQDYNQDQMAEYLRAWFENDIDIINFQLHQDPDSKISLSWHLTAAEKREIKSTVHSDQFLEELNRLEQLLK